MGDFSLTWREAWVNFAQPAQLVALGVGATLLTLVAASDWLQWLGSLAPCPVDPAQQEACWSARKTSARGSWSARPRIPLTAGLHWCSRCYKCYLYNSFLRFICKGYRRFMHRIERFLKKSNALLC